MADDVHWLNTQLHQVTYNLPLYYNIFNWIDKQHSSSRRKHFCYMYNCRSIKKNLKYELERQKILWLDEKILWSSYSKCECRKVIPKSKEQVVTSSSCCSFKSHIFWLLWIPSHPWRNKHVFTMRIKSRNCEFNIRIKRWDKNKKILFSWVRRS